MRSRAAWTSSTCRARRRRSACARCLRLSPAGGVSARARARHRRPRLWPTRAPNISVSCRVRARTSSRPPPRLHAGPTCLGSCWLKTASRRARSSSMEAKGFAGVILNTGGGRNLLDVLDIAALADFIDMVRARGMMAGLAGALEPPDVPRLLLLDPDILAFRFDAATIDGIRALIPPDQRRAREQAREGRLPPRRAARSRRAQGARPHLRARFRAADAHRHLRARARQAAARALQRGCQHRAPGRRAGRHARRALLRRHHGLDPHDRGARTRRAGRDAGRADRRARCWPIRAPPTSRCGWRSSTPARAASASRSRATARPRPRACISSTAKRSESVGLTRPNQQEQNREE